jgi:predicted ester cyclase
MEITQPRRLVERFYFEIWNTGDETVAREILDPGFRFRGSLGRERVGPDGFIDYMRSIRTALADYQCIINDLIEGDSRVAARMRFRGIHSGEFFGVPATGQEIIWSGAEVDPVSWTPDRLRSRSPRWPRRDYPTHPSSAARW